MENKTRTRRKARRRKRINLKILGIMLIIISASCICMAAVKKEDEPEPLPEAAETATEEPEKVQVVFIREERPTAKEEHSTDWDAYESYLLARIAMAEAEGESTEGKAMVIRTVLNRVWDDDFPGTIEDVIFEIKDGVFQFSSVMPGERYWNVEPDADCYKALYMVMVDHWDESEGALYFEATSNGEGTWHSKNLEYIKTVGNHNFYK
jgi:spore germination cell wall hydrolase CwlJ-like protein